MDAEKTTQVYNFPNGSDSLMPIISMLKNNGVDAATLAALNNNGLFGGDGLLALIILFAIFGGNFGGFGFGGNGRGALNMLNTDYGVQTILNALSGNSNDIANLATALNVSTNQVQNGINSVNTNLMGIGNQIGLTSQQVINAIQNGNMAITNQLCNCCCEMKQIVTNQGYENQIRTLEQTNMLGSQADRNTNTIVGAIANLQTSMTDGFYAIKERELQDKIDALTATNTTLRGQIDNANQTATINAYVASLVQPIQSEVASIKASMPNTVPVQWPNLTAVNTTPYVSGGCCINGGYGWNGNGYWS